MQTAIAQLDEFADEHELWLEVYACGKTLGKDGFEYRRLERIDLTSKATRQTVATQLITTTVERAAAELLQTLTADADPA
jgi:hypothetical protein